MVLLFLYSMVKGRLALGEELGSDLYKWILGVGSLYSNGCRQCKTW